MINEYKSLFVTVIVICLLAFIVTFLGCAAIAYKNCDAELSFSHYQALRLEIGNVVVASPEPVFKCNEVN